jgi:hypothetical protein
LLELGALGPSDLDGVLVLVELVQREGQRAFTRSGVVPVLQEGLPTARN